MDRRQFLTTTGLAASSALAPAVPAFAQGKPAATTAGDAKLNALLEKIFMGRVKRSPSFATRPATGRLIAAPSAIRPNNSQ